MKATKELWERFSFTSESSDEDFTVRLMTKPQFELALQEYANSKLPTEEEISSIIHNIYWHPNNLEVINKDYDTRAIKAAKAIISKLKQ